MIAFFFCKSSPKEYQSILNILGVCESCLAQQINRNKTTIFFSKSTLEDRTQIKEALGVMEIKQYEKYLGLPFFMGREKKASFQYIKERVWWEEKLLSQAIPTSSMSCFKFPLGLCNELKNLIKRLLWGQ